MIIILYNIILIIVWPFIVIQYLCRLATKKDTPLSFCHKLGIHMIFSPFRKYDIWFHAASVGEVKSLEFILNVYSSKKILITTTTVKSREIVLSYQNINITHQFLPLDFPILHILFFIKNRCKCVVIAESEIWPNFYLFLKIFHKKVMLFNARISKKSQERWNKFPNLLRQILSSCSSITAQSCTTQKFLQKFYPSVQYFGNLKILNLLEDYKKSHIVARFASESPNPILCVASTHEGEDELIIAEIASLTQYNVIYVPRHPCRAKTISNLLNTHNVSHSFLSNYRPNMQCLLVDEIGLLMDILSYSKIAIYGGSFLPHLKGHNVLEASRFSCGIITGHYTETFDEIVKEMKRSKAIIQCNANELPESILHASKIGENALQYIENAMPNSNKIISFFEDFINYKKI